MLEDLCADSFHVLTGDEGMRPQAHSLTNGISLTKREEPQNPAASQAAGFCYKSYSKGLLQEKRVLLSR